ncbi:methyl-accepting chemotaxis protein [Anaeromicropila herbilytica]|uniref:Methyl-accepting chemotaxis protein n=1 Tax=Anaeromicropila herbilytica TaxID=2785025 RepID=A0A7R7ELD7_9FIRM|nr:methyl-accepting chemotaxis protein [Anaeromicropila herbilytica]BCN31165.1 methyl-accepting chemotaxis protein [Anaeromicropila herbilytica]
MKFKKISTRMLTFLLSVILLSLILLSTISYRNSKHTIQSQIQTNMNSELYAVMNDIQLKLQKVSTMAEETAKSVSSTYTTTQLPQYETMLSKIIFDSDLVLGSGIWFEPYVFDKNEKYVGPYIHKDGENAKVSYEYSNADYDYFQYDWYKNAKESKSPTFSPLYYDQTLDTIMTSCSVPMYNEANFLGVITFDIQISSIQDLINHYKVGKSGTAFLLNSDGTFIANHSTKNIMKKSITKDSNTSLASLGKEIMKSKKGLGTYSLKQVKYNVYYSTIKDFGWKLAIQIPVSEINKPLDQMLTKLIIVSVLALLASILAIISEVHYVTKNIKKVTNFALKLSNGDFTTSKLDIKSRDELGTMALALNQMLEENSGIIRTISSDSIHLSDISQELDNTSNHLTLSFNEIENAVRMINEDMMSSSAATEEVNASSEEANASITYLSQETQKSYELATTIKKRAFDIEQKSKNSFDVAIQLAHKNEDNLNQSMEDAKIMDTISIMADSISDIAKQVNLLSLNASIEAARAGEHGKGFAVVANEIGNLSAETTNTVNEIKNTITLIQSAYNQLLTHSQFLLSFVKDTVTPDYQMFVDVAKQYGEDAESIEQIVTKISTMTQNIENVIGEVKDAIENVAEASQNTAENSVTVISHIDKLSQIVSAITQIVANEKDIATRLDSMVKKFSI